MVRAFPTLIFSRTGSTMLVVVLMFISLPLSYAASIYPGIHARTGIYARSSTNDTHCHHHHHHHHHHHNHSSTAQATPTLTFSSTTSSTSSTPSSTSTSTSAFTLTDFYQGKKFFEGWDFFTEADPTNGLVKYIDQAAASSSGLTFVQEDGTAVIAVDNTTHLPVGAHRNSVRISTSKSYNGGLFITDIYAMPIGCSTWPAWWSVGPNWPEGGEIDIIEGVNTGTTNQYTLHTAEGCTLDSNLPSSAHTANIVDTQCASSSSNNNGCAFTDTSTSSFGQGFNDKGGGVYVHLWDHTGIKAWFFPRDNIPSDIQSKNPNPHKWGPPAAFWSASSCSMGDHFFDHVLTFDTTLCGDWAGSVYSSSGCPGSCQEAVADPTNFDNARWKINYVAVYN